MTAKAIPFTKVILDAGHGGHDLGGTFGLTYEKHLALDVETSSWPSISRFEDTHN